MRPIAELLSELRQARVQIWLDGETLRYQAPRGALTPDLLTELRGRKPDLLAFFKQAQAATDLLPLQPVERNGDLPISLAQQRLWLIDQLSGPNATYNIPLALHLRGELEVSALEHSLATIVQRHESLRTSFRIRGDTVCACVDTQCLLPLRIVNVQHLPLHDRLPEVRRQARDETLHPFDLSQAPLIRFVLWQVDGQDQVLMMAVHHVVADGRSIEILAAELATLYNAYVTGRDTVLPALAIQYSDFAAHQRRWLTQSRLQTQLDYWSTNLAGLPPLLELPTDRPRSPVYASDGACVSSHLTKELLSQLKEIARQSGTTLYMALVAGAAALLGRHANREDVPIACPATQRNRPELDHLVGFLVNTLVLRCDLSGDPSFRELLQRTRFLVRDAFANQDAPFDAVVEALHHEPSSSYAPLVQFSMVMLDAEKARPRLRDLETEPFEIGNPVARYDLALEMYEANGAIDIFWIYNTSLFEEATVARMAAHLGNILVGAAADPECSVARLPLLDARERHTVLQAWNNTQTAFSRDRLVHQLFEDQAADTPDATAVVMAGRRLSYAELNAWANRLAHHLIALGAGPGTLVAICLERSFEQVVSMLATLKAGAAYSPIDPDYPRERITAMVADARASVLLTQTALTGRLPTGEGVMVCLDAIADTIAGMPATNPAASVAGDDLAYVIHTSGSTALPNGVMVPHRAIANHMCWMNGRFPLETNDAVLQKTSCSFDASVWEFFAPLVAGARLVLAGPGGHTDFTHLTRTIDEERVTVLQMVPTLLQGLVDHPGFQRCRSLKRIFAGGEILITGLARKAAALGADVCNLYGPTEATIDATYHCWQESELAKTVPIGRPIANTVTYVLDNRLQPAPIGVEGDLYLGGSGLASGYLHRPDLTAERFIASPFSQDIAARLYRSGDRVRWRADGHLEFLGRSDQQVRINGVRIDPGEIEAALNSHPDIEQAVVDVRDRAGGGKVLVAYVVASAMPASNELRAYLRTRLPNHMVPTLFVPLTNLPVTPSGTVDRRALPAPPSLQESHRRFSPPRNAVEDSLAKIWAEMLTVQRVGIHDSFFDLGGHSLSAVRVLARVQETFGVELPIRLLFEEGTVATMASALADTRQAARAEAAAKLRAQIDNMEPAQIEDLLRQKRAALAERQSGLEPDRWT